MVNICGGSWGTIGGIGPASGPPGPPWGGGGGGSFKVRFSMFAVGVVGVREEVVSVKASP